MQRVVATVAIAGLAALTSSCGHPNSEDPAVSAAAPAGCSQQSNEGSGFWLAIDKLLPGEVWFETASLLEDPQSPPFTAPFQKGYVAVNLEGATIIRSSPEAAPARGAGTLAMSPSLFGAAQESTNRGGTLLVDVVSYPSGAGADEIRAVAELRPDGDAGLLPRCGDSVDSYLAGEAKSRGVSKAEMLRTLVTNGRQHGDSAPADPVADFDATPPSKRQIAPGITPQAVLDRYRSARLTVSYPSAWTGGIGSDAPALCARSAIGWGDCVVLSSGAANPATVNAYFAPGAGFELVLRSGPFDSGAGKVVASVDAGLAGRGASEITVGGDLNSPIVERGPR